MTIIERIEIGKRIKQRREAMGMTQEELGNKVWLNKSTIQRYETGKIEKIKNPFINALAKALDVDPNWIIGISETVGSFKFLDDSTNTRKSVKIPVLGTVRAGLPMEAVENILDYEEITEDMARQGEFFALQIKGDSMEPRIREGDVVIVRKQPDVDNGSLAIVLVNGDEATIKKIQKFEGGINLIPSNPAYDVKTFTNEQIESLPVQILGKVVELRAKFV